MNYYLLPSSFFPPLVQESYKNYRLKSFQFNKNKNQQKKKKTEKKESK